MTGEEKRYLDNLKQVLERAKNYSALNVIEKLEKENEGLAEGKSKWHDYQEFLSEQKDLLHTPIEELLSRFYFAGYEQALKIEKYNSKENQC